MRQHSVKSVIVPQKYKISFSELFHLIFIEVGDVFSILLYFLSFFSQKHSSLKLKYWVFVGCDLMVHYGHSCLIPIQETRGIEMLYIFVSIEMNLGHFIDVLKANFEKDKKLALVSTIQFVPCLQVSFIYYIFYYRVLGLMSYGSVQKLA